MSDEHLRIGDADREQAATALGEHYAQGRLTADEHTERLDQIWVARTRAELEPVFRDLPGPARRTTTPAPVRTGRPRSGWHGGPPKLFFFVLAALVLLTALTHLPFVLAGILVAIFVVSRRRHRFAPARRMQHWSR